MQDDAPTHIPLMDGGEPTHFTPGEGHAFVSEIGPS